LELGTWNFNLGTSNLELQSSNMIADNPILNYRHRALSGFSLLELLVALTILTMITALTAPSIMRHLGGARSDAAEVEIETLSSSIEFYRLEVGKYPANLQSLVERPAGVEVWNGPYIRKKTVPKDPWGNEYVYRFPGEHGPYDLYTLGEDKALGGEGESRDIVSWE